MSSLHPDFNRIVQSFAPTLTAAEKKDELIKSRERLKLLISSADIIIDSIITGKYDTWDQALQAIADWRQAIKDEGINL